MDEETDKIVTLYAIGTDRLSNMSSFKLFSVKARLSFIDTTIDEGRGVYETTENHVEYFGRAGRQWYDDGQQASTDVSKLLKSYYSSRYYEINRLMNNLQNQMNWLKSLDKIAKDNEHASQA